MLRKLRIKFILLNMAVVVLVLTVAFTAICVLDYQQNVEQIKAALNSAVSESIENAKHRAEEAAAAEAAEAEAEAAAAGEVAGTNADATNENAAAAADAAATAAEHADDVAETFADTASASTEEAAAAASTAAATSTRTTADDTAVGTPPVIGGKRQTDQIIPIAVYALFEDGTATPASDFSTASISADVLDAAISELSQADDGTGSLPDLGLFYNRREAGGVVFLAFADVSAANSWQKLALTLLGVGAAAIVVFFVISLFFSRWALRPVARAWEQQRRFVADASHDLKTPLTVILANNSILMEHPERSIASESQWVESTQHEATAMQELVGDLLILARMDETEATRANAELGLLAPSTPRRARAAGAGSSSDAGTEGQRSNGFEHVDLTDLVEGELLQFESVAFERGIELAGDVAPDLRICGNRSHVRRLVSILIDNACKYADAGGKVTVTLHADGHRARLAVHNTGAPIAAEDLPHVFDRFYRADKARSGDGSGHGLGLAIAQAIAAEHAGTITVTSADTAGTCFTVTLPREA